MFRRSAPALIVTVVALALVPPASAQEPTNATPTPTRQPPPEAPPAQPIPAPHIVATLPADQAEAILGKQVWGTKGADMGLVVDVLIDRNATPVAAVIDFGGFLGVGNIKIAIDWRLLHFEPGDAKKPVVLDLNRDALRNAPEYRPGQPVEIVGAPQPPPQKSAPPDAQPDANSAE